MDLNFRKKKFITVLKKSLDITVVAYTILSFILNQVDKKSFIFSLSQYVECSAAIFLVFFIIVENVLNIYTEMNKNETKSNYKTIVYSLIILGTSLFYLVNMKYFNSYAQFKFVLIYIINLLGRFYLIENNELLWFIMGLHIIVNVILHYLTPTYKITLIGSILNALIPLALVIKTWNADIDANKNRIQQLTAKIVMAFIIILFIFAFIYCFFIAKQAKEVVVSKKVINRIFDKIFNRG